MNNKPTSQDDFEAMPVELHNELWDISFIVTDTKKQAREWRAKKENPDAR
jgi:hypothetical protein